jgi:hypothetical protein
MMPPNDSGFFQPRKYSLHGASAAQWHAHWCGLAESKGGRLHPPFPFPGRPHARKGLSRSETTILLWLGFGNRARRAEPDVLNEIVRSTSPNLQNKSSMASATLETERSAPLTPQSCRRASLSSLAFA